MVQPALKTFKMPDMPQPQSLAQRIEAEIRLGARPEFTVSSMAERFAPDGLRAPQDALRALPDDPPGAGPALRRCTDLDGEAKRFALTRGVVVVLTAVAIAPAAILAGLLWFGAHPRAGAHFDSGGSRLAPTPTGGDRRRALRRRRCARPGHRAVGAGGDHGQGRRGDRLRHRHRLRRTRCPSGASSPSAICPRA